MEGGGTGPWPVPILPSRCLKIRCSTGSNEGLLRGVLYAVGAVRPVRRSMIFASLGLARSRRRLPGFPCRLPAPRRGALRRRTARGGPGCPVLEPVRTSPRRSPLRLAVRAFPSIGWDRRLREHSSAPVRGVVVRVRLDGLSVRAGGLLRAFEKASVRGPGARSRCGSVCRPPLAVPAETLSVSGPSVWSGPFGPSLSVSRQGEGREGPQPPGSVDYTSAVFGR